MNITTRVDIFKSIEIKIYRNMQVLTQKIIINNLIWYKFIILLKWLNNILINAKFLEKKLNQLSIILILK